MTAVLQVPADLARYLDRLVAVLDETVELEGVYLVGSGALGGYDPARSDVDVYAVVADSLSEAQRQDVRERVGAIECPARRLELVVYSRAQAGLPQPQFDFNLGDPDASPHWFLIDRAIAEEHAVALHGPPWGDLFAPVPRQRLLESLAESLSWYERHDPTGAAVAAARTYAWLETDRWLAKRESLAWLVARVRERLEEERWTAR